MSVSDRADRETLNAIDAQYYVQDNFDPKHHELQVIERVVAASTASSGAHRFDCLQTLLSPTAANPFFNVSNVITRRDRLITQLAAVRVTRTAPSSITPFVGRCLHCSC
jgi:hypothetical protein